MLPSIDEVTSEGMYLVGGGPYAQHRNRELIRKFPRTGSLFDPESEKSMEVRYCSQDASLRESPTHSSGRAPAYTLSLAMAMNRELEREGRAAIGISPQWSRPFCTIWGGPGTIATPFLRPLSESLAFLRLGLRW